MSQPWLSAAFAARMVRLRALVAQDAVPAIVRHLSDLADLARVGGLAQLDEAVRHAGDLGSTGRPIAIVIDAIGRSVPEGVVGPDIVPVQALLANLAALARAEGATVECEAIPMLVPGPLGKRLSIALAALVGDALDHAPRPVQLKLAFKHENATLTATVEAAGVRSAIQHPFRPT